jgi:hypothetical protein
MMTVHELKDIGLAIIVTSSALHTLLPPWDWEAEFLVDFPRARAGIVRVVHNRWYKLIVYLVGFVAINARSTLWRSIAMPRQIRRLEKSGRIGVHSGPVEETGTGGK